MEHFQSPFDVLSSMFSILKVGGVALIGFSPLYKSPYGAHIKSKCKVPWVHLIFSEKTIFNVFKELYGSSAKSYSDLKGAAVNKLSYFDYINMIRNFQWKTEINYINQFSKKTWLVVILDLILKCIPLKNVKELFIIGSYVKLRKYSN